MAFLSVYKQQMFVVNGLMIWQVLWR